MSPPPQAAQSPTRRDVRFARTWFRAGPPLPSGRPVWSFAYALFLLLLASLVMLAPMAPGFALGIPLAFTFGLGGSLVLGGALRGRRPKMRWVDALAGTASILLGLLSLQSAMAGLYALVWGLGLWLTLSGWRELRLRRSVALRGILPRAARLVELMLGFYLLVVGAVGADIVSIALAALLLVARGLTLAMRTSQRLAAIQLSMRHHRDATRCGRAIR